MPFTEDNIEDWDFRHCWKGSTNYDVEADLFFSNNYTTAVAVDLLRLQVLHAFLERGFAQLDADRIHVRFTNVKTGDRFLAGWKGGASRFTSEGRFERRVIEAMRRENAKYGRLRLTIVPSEQDIARQREFLSQYSAENEGKPKAATWEEMYSLRGLTAAGDEAFSAYVEAVGGFDALVDAVQAHGRMIGYDITRPEAWILIEEWRTEGLPKNLSVGEYLDEQRRPTSGNASEVHEANGLAAIYEADAEEYVVVAASMLNDVERRPQLSRALADVATRCFARVGQYVDEEWDPSQDLTPSLVEFALYYGEITASAYALAVSEEWPDLLPAEAQAVLDVVVGMRRGEQARAVSAANLFAAAGVPGWTSYIQHNPAYARMEWFRARYVAVGEDSMQIPGDREKAEGVAVIAWRIGVALAVLELVGEFPAPEVNG